jgi:hypothetical protein
MVNNFTNNIKANNHPSPQLNEHKNTPRQMTCTKIVAEWNRSMGFQSSPDLIETDIDGVINYW